MPFPWKKVRSTRISQLVNDHLHKSQKRRDGSSLVVETGFPTSLIDLFIKNREKLKKQPKKKRQNPPNTPVSDASDPLIEGSPISFPSPSPPPPPPSIAGSPSPAQSPLRCTSPSRNLSVLALPSSHVSEISVVGSSGEGTFVGVDEKEGDDERGPDVNKVLFGVLKMFLVLVLALGTKRLAVGITISAFLLLFLEHVGKHASGLVKPCLEAKGVLRSMVRSVLRFSCYKKVKFGGKNTGVSMPELQEYLMKPCCSSVESSASRCSDHEIQVVEPKGYLAAHADEIQPENEIIDESSSEKRVGYQAIELMEMVMEKEESMCDVAELKRKSRRAKIKSKMKKYVPKKFRGSRKPHDLRRPEIVKDESVRPSEGQVDQCNNDGESENASELSSISGGRFGGEDRTSETCACGRLSEVSEETDTMKREEKGHEFEGGLTWRHLVLCLIVLIGLISGRAFALVLTLSWFLLLKLGETLPRFTKAPRIKCFDDKSR